MKVLAISGSPRAGGNTETLLRKVLAPLEEAGWTTELRQIGGKPVRGCLACFKCIERKNMRCVIENDGVNELLQAMVEADAILLGSPTFFADLSSEMKALIDRAGFVALANGGALRGKIGAAVVAVRRGGAIHVFDSINHLFQISGMITPGSLYWNVGVGQHKEEVLGDAEAMRNMEHLGRTIAWLGVGLKAASEIAPFPWPEGSGVEAC
nr:flavodoxin family protein [uncultured Holophaga sp.]